MTEPLSPIEDQSLQNSPKCTKCSKPESDEVRLMSCARCRQLHYCSKQCQVADWKRHKADCASNQGTLVKPKESDSALQLDPLTVAILHSRFEKWTQLYRIFLQDVAIAALELREHPERCYTHVLCIILTPNWSIPFENTDNVHIAKSFEVQDAYVVAIAELIEKESRAKEAFDQILSEAKSMQEEGESTIGSTIVRATVPAIKFTRILPTCVGDGWDAPELMAKYTTNWKTTLESMMSSGHAG
ncbi:hypothetical protein BDQ12DRAFT_127510 [Crucibulum laeve]|uniref:MYND-type domain-containing protein n=1 Tax=Crucibulum laeve TaxID=68775 RepID=A0A5C3LYG1_9AGAR|nr:hypothetical protein BDQ12DRAFT_127510 [Crucibulum laeve]